ncbi:MAG: hypothetical protein ACOX8H_09410 [Ruminococcus sp.]|jgi:stage III sporulation protein AG
MSISVIHKMTEKLKKLKKEQLMVFFLLLGLLIVVMLPVRSEEKTETVQPEEALPTSQPEEQETLAGQLEQQLVDTLSQVEGVGRVKAAVTLETSGRKVVEKDVPVSDSSSSQTDQDGGTQDSQSSSSEEETVYQRDSEGNEVPYVVQETTPEIRGVVVVAQGGGDPVVERQIQEAVMALFHVDAHKIKVMKMK